MVSAQAVMREFSDVRIAFGESDEFSFVFHKNSQSHRRRANKLVTLLVSCFASNYVMQWSQ